MAVQMLLLGFQNWLLRICTCLISLFDQDSLSCLKNQNHHLSLTDQYIGSTERVARLYRVYLLHLLCSGNTVPGTEFRELHFLLVVPWKVFPEQIIVEVLGPQRAYRPEISRQVCLQGCGCGEGGNITVSDLSWTTWFILCMLQPKWGLRLVPNVWRFCHQ